MFNIGILGVADLTSEAAKKEAAPKKEAAAKKDSLWLTNHQPLICRKFAMTLQWEADWAYHSHAHVQNRTKPTYMPLFWCEKNKKQCLAKQH